MKSSNWPFNTNKSQKIASTIIIFASIFVMVVAPILPETKDYLFFTTAFGFIFSMIGLGYYLASFD